VQGLIPIAPLSIRFSAELVIAYAARKCGVEQNLCTPCSLFAADGRRFLARFTIARMTYRFGNLLAPYLTSYWAPHAAAGKCSRPKAVRPPWPPLHYGRPGLVLLPLPT
jgi:hypothetical protein